MCVFGGPSFGRICPDSGTHFPDFFNDPRLVLLGENLEL